MNSNRCNQRTQRRRPKKRPRGAPKNDPPDYLGDPTESAAEVDAYDLAFPHGEADDDHVDRPRRHHRPCHRPQPFNDAQRKSTLPSKPASVQSAATSNGRSLNGSNLGSTKNGKTNDVLPSMLCDDSMGTSVHTNGTVHRSPPPPSSSETSPAALLMRHPLWAEINEPSTIIAITPVVAALLTEGNEMLVMAQVLYWFRTGDDGQPRARIEFEGHLWIAKTYEEMGREIHRSGRQVKKAVKALQSKGFLFAERHRSQYHAGQTVTHLRPNLDGLAASWNAVVAKGDQEPCCVEGDLE